MIECSDVLWPIERHAIVIDPPAKHLRVDPPHSPVKTKEFVDVQEIPVDLEEDSDRASLDEPLDEPPVSCLTSFPTGVERFVSGEK